MILVDTSVWVDHLRRGDQWLAALLLDVEVVCHPMVVGELALGTLRKRAQLLEYLSALPYLPVAEHDEVLELIESRRLMGTGVGWVDAHLLASALLAGVPISTRDGVLASQAARLGIAAEV